MHFHTSRHREPTASARRVVFAQCGFQCPGLFTLLDVSADEVICVVLARAHPSYNVRHSGALGHCAEIK